MAVRTRQQLKTDDTKEEMALLQKLRNYYYVRKYSALHLLDHDVPAPTAVITDDTPNDQKTKIKGQDHQYRSSWEKLRKTIVEALPENRGSCQYEKRQL